MRQLLARLAVALLTFTVGVCAVTLRLNCPKQATADDLPLKAETLAAAPSLPSPRPAGCTLWVPETAEEKAVRLAREFIAWNGYTGLPSSRSDPPYETVETADSVEGMLLNRFDTLEPRPYGLRYGGRNGGGGFTVVFRYTNRMGDYSKNVGRAVTMDADFRNLRVEHKDFFLRKVHKKF